MIYTPVKMNLDYFLKFQNEMSYGKDAKEYEFIPKLMDLVFKRIVEVKTKKNISCEVVYEYLYCLQEWSNTSEESLVSYKVNLI